MKIRLLSVTALAALFFAGNASAALVITEVMSSSGATANTADWFELTNTGASAVDITGYKMDDNSFAIGSAVALSGITSIGAGESVVFIEGTSSTAASFKTLWSLGSGVQVGYYSGSGVSLSSSGDGVIVFDGSGTEVNRVTFGAATTGSSFYYNGASALTDISLAGQRGAYTSSGDTASPGVYVTAVPEPSTYGLIGAGALAGVAFVRRRRAGLVR